MRKDLDGKMKMKCNGCEWTGIRDECIDWGEEYDPVCPTCEQVCVPSEPEFEKEPEGRFEEAGNFTFALRGNKGPKVHASISMTPLEIKGNFNFRGPQVADGSEGSAPKWVFEAFENDETLESISVGRKGTGIVYARMKNE